jgi:mRNA-degrading endonuclease toxin of MazEF toxin-antitoxin module
MRQGDIWLVDLDPIRGHEQAGRRPVLIVSPDAFNRVNPPICLPITRGGDYPRQRGFTVPLTGYGLNVEGLVLCNQVRAVDLSARNGRKIETAPAAVLQEALARLATILGLENEP